MISQEEVADSWEKVVKKISAISIIKKVNFRTTRQKMKYLMSASSIKQNFASSSNTAEKSIKNKIRENNKKCREEKCNTRHQKPFFFKQKCSYLHQKKLSSWDTVNENKTLLIINHENNIMTLIDEVNT